MQTVYGPPVGTGLKWVSDGICAHILDHAREYDQNFNILTEWLTKNTVACAQPPSCLVECGH